jgi:hypothetical protein
MQIGYDRIKSVYFQNPTFGFYFLRLTSARLFQNIRNLEAALEERDREIQHLKAAAEAAKLRRLSFKPPSDARCHRRWSRQHSHNLNASADGEQQRDEHAKGNLTRGSNLVVRLERRLDGMASR